MKTSILISLLFIAIWIPQTVKTHKSKSKSKSHSKSRESDSTDSSSNSMTNMTDTYNLTEICNCTLLFEEYNFTTSLNSSSSVSSDSGDSTSHSKGGKRKGSESRQSKGGKKRPGRHLGSKSKDSHSKKHKKSKDSSSRDSSKKNKKKNKLHKLRKICSDYCEEDNTTLALTTAIMTTVAETTTASLTTEQVTTTTEAITTTAVPCQTSQSPVEICTGDITTFECSTFGEICTNIGNNVYQCCVENNPQALSENTNFHELTFGEQIQYYYVNNTGMFLTIIAILSFVIIVLIVGFTLFICKLKKKGYVKTGANDVDVIQPKYEKNKGAQTTSIDVDSD